MKKFLLVTAFFAVLSVSSLAQDPVTKEIKSGVLNGKALKLPKPEYPEAAKVAGLEGAVEVRVVIDEGGNVVSAIANSEPRKVYRTTNKSEEAAEEVPAADPILRDAAERAAWEAKFSPTLLQGNPVRVSGVIVYNFVSSSATAGSKELSGGVLNGKAITLPKPEYPEPAKAVRAGGAVSVQVTVDENGDVIAATAVSGHPLLRSAATTAASGAKFAPTRLNGNPVKVTGVITYNFVPADPENE